MAKRRDLRVLFNRMAQSNQRRARVSQEPTTEQKALAEIMQIAPILQTVGLAKDFLGRLVINAPEAQSMYRVQQWLMGMEQGLNARLDQLKAQTPQAVPEAGATVTPAQEIAKVGAVSER